MITTNYTTTPVPFVTKNNSLSPYLLHDFLEESFQEEKSILTDLKYKNQLELICKEITPVSGMIFEKHLGKSQTDFAIRIANLDFSNERLIKQTETLFSAIIATDKAIWDNFIRIFQKWMRQSSPLNESIETFWFEFDLDKPKSIPSLFFDNPFQLGASEIATTLKKFGQSISAKVISKLLPESFSKARIHQTGIMLARQKQPCRFCIKGIAMNEVLPYLKEINWQGNYSVLEKLISSYLDKTSDIVLHFDIKNEHLSTKLGFEFCHTEEKQWSNTMDQMMLDELCTIENKEEILGFPMVAKIQNESTKELLSESLQQPVSLIIKRINHAKLNIDEKGQVEAKVYLYLCYY